MTVKPDSRKRTPEAQLRAYIDKLDPKNQKLFRSVRAAVRKRFPTANELAYDYSYALVIGYSPADRGIDSIVAIRADDTVCLCTSVRDLSCPTRSGFCGDRESRLASSRWRRPASWHIQTWKR